MVTKEQFDSAAHVVRSNPMALISVMIDYKSDIQRAVIPKLTASELADIRDSRINETVIDKLCQLTEQKWHNSAGDATTLYCAAMAVATIVKEYEWGMHYLSSDGLWDMAQRIANAGTIA